MGMAQQYTYCCSWGGREGRGEQQSVPHPQPAWDPGGRPPLYSYPARLSTQPQLVERPARDLE